MELRCEDCQAVIQIPDERVPQSGTFRLNCPRCKRKIQASVKTPENREDSQDHLGLSASLTEKTTLLSNNPSDALSEVMDYIPPGQASALLCVNRDESRRELKVMLEASGYVVDIPAAADQALQRLRFNQYHVILLDDDFEGKSPNPVAQYLASLNMNIRRDMFVVLIGKRFKTADHLQAFMESMNLILHPDDLPHLGTFLSRGLSEHERFYKVYTQCLIEAGKKL
jgi:CheY-like chemotaxis protein